MPSTPCSCRKRWSRSWRADGTGPPGFRVTSGHRQRTQAPRPAAGSSPLARARLPWPSGAVVQDAGGGAGAGGGPPLRTRGAQRRAPRGPQRPGVDRRKRSSEASRERRARQPVPNARGGRLPSPSRRVVQRVEGAAPPARASPPPPGRGGQKAPPGVPQRCEGFARRTLAEASHRPTPHPAAGSRRARARPSADPAAPQQAEQHRDREGGGHGQGRASQNAPAPPAAPPHPSPSISRASHRRSPGHGRRRCSPRGRPSTVRQAKEHRRAAPDGARCQ